jgi:hypothetical protein
LLASSRSKIIVDNNLHTIECRSDVALKKAQNKMAAKKKAKKVAKKSAKKSAKRV